MILAVYRERVDRWSALCHFMCHAAVSRAQTSRAEGIGLTCRTMNPFPRRSPKLGVMREPVVSSSKRMASHGSRSDSARLVKFCGITRMIPVRGLSMSAMRKNAMDAIKGNTNSRDASDLMSRTP